MKTFEQILQNEKTFVSKNEKHNAQCVNKRTRMYVACFEEIFEAIKTSERVGMFNAEYSDTKSKSKDLDVTYARVIDTSDNKSFIQLYGKENGKTYDVVFTNKYHKEFSEAFSKKYKERFKYDTSHCIKYCDFSEVVEVIATIQSVLNASKHVFEEVKKEEVKTTSKANVNGKERTIRTNKKNAKK